MRHFNEVVKIYQANTVTVENTRILKLKHENGKNSPFKTFTHKK
jgi:hypothetical protein